MSTTTTSEACLLALTLDDLAKGKGSQRQQDAYRELEWRKCAASAEYFLNTYGWLKTKSGSIAKWELWPLQVKLLSDLNKNSSVIAVKARQLGVTTLTTHYFLWRVLFQEAAQCHLVSDSEDKAKEALTRVRITLDRLPEWMKERARRGGKADEDKLDRKDKANSRKSITFGYSEFTIRTSTPNSVAGLTGSIALDEFSRHRDQEAVYDNVIPAIDGGGQLIVIANGQGEDEFYHLFQAAKQGNGMVPYFFSWRDDPTRDDAWYEETKQKYLRDNAERNIWNFRAQYPSTEEEAFYISGDSRFDLSTLQGMNILLKAMPSFSKGFVRPAEEGYEFVKHSRAGAMRMFEPPDPDGIYVLGVDPAGGGQDSDNSVIQVGRVYQHDRKAFEALCAKFSYDAPPLIDTSPAFEVNVPDDFFAIEQVAVHQGKTEPTLLALQAKRIAEWYNDALVVVEKNQHGGTVITRMKNDYWNLYRRVTNEGFSDKEDEAIGYWTDKFSKHEMIDELALAIQHVNFFIRDSATIAELSRFGYQYSASGRSSLSAPKGMNDDLVSGCGLMVIGARSLLLERSTRPSRYYRPWEM